jgi:hypothetical protein
MFKYTVRIFVEKIYKMGFLESSGVPVLYIGRTVPKGYERLINNIMKILTQLFTRNLLMTRQDNNCFGHTGHHQVLNTRMLTYKDVAQ